jgi:hypothetical protein
MPVRLTVKSQNKFKFTSETREFASETREFECPKFKNRCLQFEVNKNFKSEILHLFKKFFIKQKYPPKINLQARCQANKPQ